MIRLSKDIQHQKIRLCVLHNLIFFVLILFSACNSRQEDTIKILWHNNQATGILIPEALAGNISADSIGLHVLIRSAADSSNTNILGNYKISSDGILFEPIVPFSRGSTYEVFSRDRRIILVQIPLANAADAPDLVSVYPRQDTVPENLLKIYLQFSKPMREGESQKYISLIKNDRDTLHDVFLDLQPELWNEDRTVITIWLDPGRIKRDLQPNRRLGNPLKKGEHYKLAISDQWQDVQGLRLKKEYTKKVFVGLRDSVSPDPKQWDVSVPEKATIKPLEINLKEALDHFLLKETINISHENGNPVKGKMEVLNKEKMLRFTPSSPWISGNYVLVVETRLEDLTGNNINRPFDRDIASSKEPGTKAFFERSFYVK